MDNLEHAESTTDHIETNLGGLSSKVENGEPITEMIEGKHYDIKDGTISLKVPVQDLLQVRSLNLSMYALNNISDLKGLSGLEELHLHITEKTDTSSLKGLTKLEMLVLNQLEVSDIGFLEGLTTLKELYLDGAALTNISALSGLNNLHFLKLNNTGIYDISALKNLKNLQNIYLSNTPGLGAENIISIKEHAYFKNLKMLVLDKALQNNKLLADLEKAKEEVNPKLIIVYM